MHNGNDAFDPKQLQLQNDSLRVKSLKAAREDKLTLGLYELPQEVSKINSTPKILKSPKPTPWTIVDTCSFTSSFIAMASPQAMS